MTDPKSAAPPAGTLCGFCGQPWPPPPAEEPAPRRVGSEHPGWCSEALDHDIRLMTDHQIRAVLAARGKAEPPPAADPPGLCAHGRLAEEPRSMQCTSECEPQPVSEPTRAEEPTREAMDAARLIGEYTDQPYPSITFARYIDKAFAGVREKLHAAEERLARCFSEGHKLYASLYACEREQAALRNRARLAEQDAKLAHVEVERLQGELARLREIAKEYADQPRRCGCARGDCWMCERRKRLDAALAPQEGAEGKR